MSTRNLLGRFVWHDLMTTELSASLSFYRSLFPEWSIREIDMEESGVYHVIHVDGTDVGGFISLEPATGIPSHWISYVSVEDCEAAVQAATALGGTCLFPTMEVPGVGRFAVIQDPQGAMIKPFEVAGDVRIPDDNASGRFCWDELLTDNVDAARSFYRTLFGWSSIERMVPGLGAYTLFRAGEQDVAGVLPMPPDSESISGWLTYLSAADLDERCSKAEALGATVRIKPQNLSGVGRIAVLSDPNGATFAMLNRLEQGS